MFVGTPHVPLVLEPAQFELINRKELVIQGSWMNYSAPFPGWEWTFGAEALATGRIQTDALIDRILPLSQAQRIPALLGMPGQLKGKLVLDCAA
jgi:threonine dehydrogenase-like Zn-dependent dehydrogenase